MPIRRLRPDSRGIIRPVPAVIKHGGQVTHYTRPNPSLKRIDRLIDTKKPRIAITRKQGGIGDVMMTLPTVKAISTKYGILVDYGTDPAYLNGALIQVLQGNPYINAILPWKDVSIEDYDAVIDLTCPCVDHEVPKARPINRIDLFAKHAGIKLINKEIDYFITPEETEWANEYLAENQLSNPMYKLVVVQLSATATARSAPADKIKQGLMQAVRANRDIRVILLTHSSDLVKYRWDYAEVHTMHDFDIRHIAPVMAQANLIVCPDSVMLHLAAALHQRTLALFGPTDPNARVNYHPEAVAIWPAKHLRNYPVWYENPGDGYLCWKLLDPELITKCILAMVDNNPLPQSDDLVHFGNEEVSQQYYEIL